MSERGWIRTSEWCYELRSDGVTLGRAVTNASNVLAYGAGGEHLGYWESVAAAQEAVEHDMRLQALIPKSPDKQHAEVDFWRGLVGSVGMEKFREIRLQDLQWKTRFFPEVLDESGLGLDLACGLLSIFEFADRPVVAVDALLDEYREILELTGTLDLAYQKEDGENLSFKDETFDWIFCCNAIDHTPNPEKMVSEMRRVLKPGGRLYFEVNYDPALYAPHYQLWRRAEVDHHLRDFKMLLAIEEYWAEHHKYLFWGKYEKS